MLKVKSFNEKHKGIAKVITYLALFIISILSILFRIVDLLFGSWKRTLGIVLAILLLVGAFTARNRIATDSAQDKASGSTASSQEVVETQSVEQTDNSMNTVVVANEEAPKSETEASEAEAVKNEAEEKKTAVDAAEEPHGQSSDSTTQEQVVETTAQQQTTEVASQDQTTETATQAETTTTQKSAPLVMATDKATVEKELSSYMEAYPEMVGWLYFEDGHISYPIMQGSDNEKYRKLGYDGEEAWTGAIFLDSRSASDFSDSNSIVYGHNMKDKTMFGTLRDYREDPGYYDTHQYFLIITPENTYKYHIFAYMDVPNHYVIYDYVGKASLDFVKDAEPVRIKSYMDSEIVVNKTKKVVTLSTCTDKDELRFVVLGVMVED
ncbi:MAG: sortase [Butyrivibrio sp.]|nr:sortase [Butyrivibrio sp.]